METTASTKWFSPWLLVLPIFGALLTGVIMPYAADKKWERQLAKDFGGKWSGDFEYNPANFLFGFTIGTAISAIIYFIKNPKDVIMPAPTK